MSADTSSSPEANSGAVIAIAASAVNCQGVPRRPGGRRRRARAAPRQGRPTPSRPCSPACAACAMRRPRPSCRSKPWCSRSPRAWTPTPGFTVQPRPTTGGTGWTCAPSSPSTLTEPLLIDTDVRLAALAQVVARGGARGRGLRHPPARRPGSRSAIVANGRLVRGRNHAAGEVGGALRARRRGCRGRDSPATHATRRAAARRLLDRVAAPRSASSSGSWTPPR